MQDNHDAVWLIFPMALDSPTRRRFFYILRRLAPFTAFMGLLLVPVFADTNTTEPSPEAVAGKSAVASASNALAVPGNDGWLFSTQELSHLGKPQYWSAGAGTTMAGDPMPAILDFKRQLDAAGIELLLVPVPPKVVVYSDKFGGSPYFIQSDQAFYRALEAQGVKVLDMTKTFQAARKTNSAPIYSKQDTHWAPEGIRIAADRIAEKIKGLPFLATEPKLGMKSSDVRVTVKGDLAQGQAGISQEEETFSARLVVPTEGGGTQPVEPSRSSPVILLGDSHNLIFHSGGDMHAAGCGLPEQLSLALGFPVDLVAVRGSGSTSARRNLARRKDNLQGKKLVIWCFTAREFTEGEGWLKVPVIKAP